MFGKGKNKDLKSKQEEKNIERRESLKPRQSRNGELSCLYGLASILVLAGCIFYSFLERGKAGGFISGIAIISLVISGYGIWFAKKGFREKGRNYLSCKIGIALCLLPVIIFIALFIGGLN